eukprot:g3199.t1
MTTPNPMHLGDLSAAVDKVESFTWAPQVGTVLGRAFNFANSIQLGQSCREVEKKKDPIRELTKMGLIDGISFREKHRLDRTRMTTLADWRNKETACRFQRHTHR